MIAWNILVAGGMLDPVTGLVRFGLRDYETDAGRWMAHDPLPFDSCQANPQDVAGETCLTRGRRTANHMAP